MKTIPSITVSDRSVEAPMKAIKEVVESITGRRPNQTALTPIDLNQYPSASAIEIATITLLNQVVNRLQSGE